LIISGRADEHEPGGGTRLGERGALGEEPVTGMDRVGAGRLRDAHELLDVEVALDRGGRTDRVRLVGHEHVERLAVRLGEDGDGRDSELAARADHAHGDLAAVRDEDLRDPACAHDWALKRAGTSMTFRDSIRVDVSPCSA